MLLPSNRSARLNTALVWILSLTPLGNLSAAAADQSTPSNSNPAATQEKQQDISVNSVATSSVTTDSAGTADVALTADLARPIETTFVPDLFTGTLSASVTIQAPPGRGAVQPHVKLNYRSTSQNGLLGMGWDIDLGTIERSTRFGVSFDCDEAQIAQPCYNLTLDGAKQPLIRVGVNLFRPKIDDSFLRIRRLTGDGGLTYWEVTDKRGMRSRFGSTLTAQQQDAGRVFKWALDRIEDTNGNYMTVSYSSDHGQVYLDHVDYTGNIGLAPPNRIQFVLEDGRSDYSDTFNYGFAVSTQRRLKSIDVYVRNALQRRYELQYTASEATAGRSLLVNVTLHGRDVAQTLPPVTFNYQGDPGSWFPFAITWGNGPGVKPGVRDQCFNGDFDGDGKMDLACYSGKQDIGWYVALSTGAKWNGSYWPVGPTAGPHVSFPVGWQCIPGDFNGDGKTDLACYTQQGQLWHVALSDGTKWRGSYWDKGPAGGSKVGDICIGADFNGDGKTDLACWTQQGRLWHVALSTGAGWVQGLYWNDGPIPGSPIRNKCVVGDFNGDGKADLACTDGSGTWDLAFSTGASWRRVVRPGPRSTNCSVGDFNGDGLADLACFDKATGWTVALGTGDGWASSLWSADPGLTPTGRCVFGDLNGDGRTDIACYVLQYSGRNIVREYWRVGIATGRSWAVSDWDRTADFRYLDPNLCFTGDLVGTGKMEIVCNAGNRNWIFIFPNGPTPDLLTRTTTSSGGQITADYKITSTDYPSPHTQLPFPVNVVKSVQTADGRGAYSTKTTTYANGFYDFVSREFRGFGAVTTVDPLQSVTDRITTTYSFNQGIEPPTLTNDYSGLVGKLSKTVSADATGKRLLEQTIAYEDNGAKAPFFNPPSQIDNYTCEGVACDKHSILHTRYERVYGNLIREEHVADVADRSQDVLIERTFSHDDMRWIVGLPLRETRSEGISSPKTAAIVEFGYDEFADCDASGSGLPVKGNLTSLKHWLTGSTYSRWLFGYDSLGNNICQRDPNGALLRVTFDDTFNTLPISFTNPLNQPTRLRYYGVDGIGDDHGLVGQLKDLTNANKATTAVEYDTFGRPTKMTGADGAHTEWSYNSFGNPTQQNIRTVTPSGIVSFTYFDGLGREWRNKRTGPDREVTVRESVYGARGRTERQSFPYFEGKETPRWTAFTYDPLLRPTTIAKPDGTLKKMCYRNWTTIAIDENGHVRAMTNDGYGRLARVDEYLGSFASCDDLVAVPNGIAGDGSRASATILAAPPAPFATTLYRYTALDRLSMLRDAQGNETRLGYDGLANLTSRQDPDSGGWSYSYDLKGNLLTRTDSEGRSVFLQYDRLDRIVQKDYGKRKPLGKGDYQYTYDLGQNATGRLYQAKDPYGRSTFSYDDLGRVATSIRLVKRKSYTFSFTYDYDGRIASLTYPTGRMATYTYDGPVLATLQFQGALQVQRSKFDALGRPGSVVYSNGVVGKYTYGKSDNPLCPRDDYRICSITFQDRFNRDLRGFLYSYDKGGNVKTIKEDNTRTLVADYDDADRLVEVAVRSAATAAADIGRDANSTYLAKYAYDKIGNMTFNSGVGAYHYPTSGILPHAVTDAGNQQFTYDKNGNLIRSTRRALVFDAEERPVKVVLRRRFGGVFFWLFPRKVTTEFAYSWDGSRLARGVARMVPYPLAWVWPKQRILFLNELSECACGKCSDYLVAEGSLVSKVPARMGHSSVISADGLGSTRLLTDEKTKKKLPLDYAPFGEVLSKRQNDRLNLDQKFTGQRLDSGTEFYFFNFRYYDGLLGRFISPDVFKGAVERPQQLNRYSYVANNPLTRIDRNGMDDQDSNTSRTDDARDFDTDKSSGRVENSLTARLSDFQPDTQSRDEKKDAEDNSSSSPKKDIDSSLRTGVDHPGVKDVVGLLGISISGTAGSMRYSNTISAGIACCNPFTFMGPYLTEAHSDEKAAQAIGVGLGLAPVVIGGYGDPNGYLGQSRYASGVNPKTETAS
jgi:RHS repeat-associated protein